MPDDRTIVVERFRDELGDWRVCLLTPFGARVHAPWGLAIEARLVERFGNGAQVMWTDDGIVLRLPESVESLPVETFFFELHDRPDAVRGLAESIAGYWQETLAVAVRSPAEVNLLGANYDAAIQHPRFFAEYIRPGLAEFAAALHDQGKYLLTHTDGENRRLLPLYLRAGFDIADSLCPAPMTRPSSGS